MTDRTRALRSKPVMQDWERDWPPDRLAEVAGTTSASYLDPSTPVRVHQGVMDGIEVMEAIVPRTIIEVGGLYLVESIDEPDNWWMGSLAADGGINCWATYGDLESALLGL
jgi:hypothetical protein